MYRHSYPEMFHKAFVQLSDHCMSRALEMKSIYHLQKHWFYICHKVKKNVKYQNAHFVSDSNENIYVPLYPTKSAFTSGIEPATSVNFPLGHHPKNANHYPKQTSIPMN